MQRAGTESSAGYAKRGEGGEKRRYPTRVKKKTKEQEERDKNNAAVDNIREEKDDVLEKAKNKAEAEEREKAAEAARRESEREVEVVELSEYEQQRAKRVARNKDRLKSLGLA